MPTKLFHELNPTHEEIQFRAYELWEKGGRQPNRALEYWLQAETQLNTAGSSHPHEPAVHAKHRGAKLRPFGVEGTRRPVL